MTTIAQLLREKGHAVFSIGPDETVYEARGDVGNDGRRPGAAASHARDRTRHRSDDRRRACRYPASYREGLERGPGPVRSDPTAQWRANNQEPPAIPTAPFFCYDGAR